MGVGASCWARPDAFLHSPHTTKRGGDLRKVFDAGPTPTARSAPPHDLLGNRLRRSVVVWGEWLAAVGGATAVGCGTGRAGPLGGGRCLPSARQALPGAWQSTLLVYIF